VSGAGGFIAKVFSRFQTPRTSTSSDVETGPAPTVVVSVPDNNGSSAAPVRPPTGARRSNGDSGNSNLRPTSAAVNAQMQADEIETRDPAREAALLALETDMLKLCTLTGGTLVRVKRPPATTSPTSAATPGRRRVNLSAGAPTESVVADTGMSQNSQGPLEIGMELAQSIEQRARGLLLETSLTRMQQERLERLLQSVLDLIVALRAARYAWQISLLLPAEGGPGRAALPRLRRVVEQAIEMSSRVTFAIEGKEGAASSVAEHYRTFLNVKTEAAEAFAEMRNAGLLPQTTRRLVRAALFTLTVSAESMAKVAARFALPLGTARQVSIKQNLYKHLDQGDDLLAPLRRP